jgi:hypothetical protein
MYYYIGSSHDYFGWAARGTGDETALVHGAVRGRLRFHYAPCLSVDLPILGTKDSLLYRNGSIWQVNIHVRPEVGWACRRPDLFGLGDREAYR